MTDQNRLFFANDGLPVQLVYSYVIVPKGITIKFNISIMCHFT
jgi:hypothetical protein